MLKKIFSFTISIFIVSCFFSSIVNARDIRVTGFTGPRVRNALILPGGLPPTSTMETQEIYSELKNNNNFGPSGIVRCPILFDEFFSEISQYDLVDPSGERKYDIFFGGMVEVIPLSQIETSELNRFLQSGGIIHFAAQQPFPDSGSGYNLLFSNLGFGDRVLDEAVFPSVLPSTSLGSQIDTPTTIGPFGEVGTLRHSSMKNFSPYDLESVFSTFGADGNLYPLVLEKSVGAGYLSFATTPIHRDILFSTSPLNNNRKYFLNMFAMACPSEEQKVLNVPSVKQGIYPFTGDIPFWQKYTYDSADKQNLYCGTTIGQCGCALTSAVMVMKYYGINDDGSWLISPGRVDGVFSEDEKPVGHGYKSWGYSFGDFMWNMVGNYTSLAHNVYPSQPKLDQIKRENFDLNNIKAYIDEGRPVILMVRRGNGGIHWVVVRGYKGNELIINDPATADPLIGFSTLSSLNYIPENIRSMITYKETYSDFSFIEMDSKNKNILVLDQFGNRTGYDPETDQIYEEIPDSQYNFDEQYSNPFDSDSVATNDGVYSILIQRPDLGEYRSVGNTGSAISVSNINGFSKDFVFNDSVLGFHYDPVSQNELLRKKVNLAITPMSKGLDNSLADERDSLIVGILSDNYFNAIDDIDKESITFGLEGNEDSLKKCFNVTKDLNQDGIPDLLCLFDLTQFDASGGEFVLKGSTDDYDLYGKVSVN